MEKKKPKNRKYWILLEIAGFLLLFYVLSAPFLPMFFHQAPSAEEGVVVNVKDIASSSDIEIIKKEARNFVNSLPEAEYSVSKNRLIIPKIGVNAPIVEAKDEKYGLSRGAWRVPESSTPDRGGNTVITGHRFQYLPPNNLTFYRFHELEIGDIITVIWEDQEYVYAIGDKKVVPASDLSIQAPSQADILTLYTCDPVYSTKNRLVVVAEPISMNR